MVPADVSAGGYSRPAIAHENQTSVFPHMDTFQDKLGSDVDTGRANVFRRLVVHEILGSRLSP